MKPSALRGLAAAMTPLRRFLLEQTCAQQQLASSLLHPLQQLQPLHTSSSTPPAATAAAAAAAPASLTPPGHRLLHSAPPCRSPGGQTWSAHAQAHASEAQPTTAHPSGAPHAAAQPHETAEALRAALLDAGLRQVATHGWSPAALVAAAHELHLSPSAAGLIPRREAQLVSHFLRVSDDGVRAQMAARSAELLALPLEARLQLCLRLRLEALAPHIGSWPQALSIAARPAELRQSVASLAALINDVWVACGDVPRSNDPSWYARRAVLGAVYSTTELFMVSDYSPGFRDTWGVLERRIADVVSLGRKMPGGSATAAGLGPGAGATEAAQG